MDYKTNIFSDDSYKDISDFVEKRIPILRGNEDFKQKNLRLSRLMEEIGDSLPEDRKADFRELERLIYQTEEYYFAFAYSLGVKYGQELGKI